MDSKSYNDPAEMVKMLQKKQIKDDGYIGLTPEDREARMKEVFKDLDDYMNKLEQYKENATLRFMRSSSS